MLSQARNYTHSWSETAMWRGPSGILCQVRVPIESVIGIRYNVWMMLGPSCWCRWMQGWYDGPFCRRCCGAALSLNAHTFTLVLRCVTPDLGEQLHGHIVKSCAYGAFVGSFLVDLYARNGDLGYARWCLIGLWTKMLSVSIAWYQAMGESEMQWDLYRCLRKWGMRDWLRITLQWWDCSMDVPVLKFWLSRQLHAHAIIGGF